MIFPIVGGQCIAAVANFKFAFGNTVAIPANNGTKIGWLCKIAAQAVKAQHNTAFCTIFIGRNPGSYHATIGRDF